jgi:integrase
MLAKGRARDCADLAPAASHNCVAWYDGLAGERLDAAGVHAAAAIRALRAQIGALPFTIHGWRYTAASQLAAAGATDDEVQAITGHKSRAMVMKYAGAQRQRARATSGQAKR